MSPGKHTHNFLRARTLMRVTIFRQEQADQARLRRVLGISPNDIKVFKCVQITSPPFVQADVNLPRTSSRDESSEPLLFTCTLRFELTGVVTHCGNFLESLWTAGGRLRCPSSKLN